MQSRAHPVGNRAGCVRLSPRDPARALASRPHKARDRYKMVRHGDLLLRPIPEPKKVLAAAEVAAFTLATSEATHTLTGRIEPATAEVSGGTAIPVVHVL